VIFERYPSIGGWGALGCSPAVTVMVGESLEVQRRSMMYEMTHTIDVTHERFNGVLPATERDLDEYENDMQHGIPFPSRRVQKGLAMGTCLPRHWTPGIRYRFHPGQDVPAWWKPIGCEV